MEKQHNETQMHGGEYNEGDYLSISQAAAQLGLTQSAIRQGVRTGKVHSLTHKWGTRVRRSDVEKLKETAPAASNKPIVH
jgi:hypothetical protein